MSYHSFEIARDDLTPERCGAAGLDPYLDGELPAERESELFRHLSDCRGCRDYLNGVLVFRRAMLEEFIVVPPNADDELLVRINGLRRSGERTARLHANEPLWTASATVTVRSVILAVCVAVLSAVLLSDHMAGGVGTISFEQERVRFDQRPSEAGSQIYIFYPGLTIEAERDPN